MADPFISQITLFGCTYAPRDWALCYGQIVPVNDNPTLFSLLGAYYGGDGRTSFGIPDFRGRSPIGMGTGDGLTTRNIGQKGGQEAVQLNLYTLPAHSHTISAEAESTGQLSGAPSVTTIVNCNDNNASATSVDPGGRVWARSNGSKVYGDTFLHVMHEDAVQVSIDMSTVGVNVQTTLDNVQIGATGGSEWHINMQPYQVINYSIATQGLYPPRT